MKPKDLKYPDSEKKVQVLERIWHIPPGLEDFVFEGFSSPLFFNNRNPTYLEICSGNGLWIAEKAKSHPEVNWAGIEIKWGRIRKIWAKIANHRLQNLMGVYGEAHHTIQKFLPHESVDKIFINFPDPWPKRRHAKYRLVQTPFIEQMKRILKTGGEVCIVTDDQPYSDQIMKLMLKAFTPKHAAPHYLTELEGYGTSYFEDLWREKKKEIRYHIFIKP